MCRSMGKAIIVIRNMLESMIVHPTSTSAEVSDIVVAVPEGANAVMLYGETAHEKYVHFLLTFLLANYMGHTCKPH
jgi:pyruvate kinase